MLISKVLNYTYGNPTPLHSPVDKKLHGVSLYPLTGKTVYHTFGNPH